MEVIIDVGWLFDLVMEVKKPRVIFWSVFVRLCLCVLVWVWLKQPLVGSGESKEAGWLAHCQKDLGVMLLCMWLVVWVYFCRLVEVALDQPKIPTDCAEFARNLCDSSLKL